MQLPTLPLHEPNRFRGCASESSEENSKKAAAKTKRCLFHFEEGTFRSSFFLRREELLKEPDEPGALIQR
jgi:hypothetical protein